MINQLIQKIQETKAPICVGLIRCLDIYRSM